MKEHIEHIISLRNDEINFLQDIWDNIKILDKRIGLKESTMEDIEIRINSKIDYLKIAIEEQNELLKNVD